MGKHSKVKVANKKKFVIFLIIIACLIAAVVFGSVLAVNKIKNRKASDTDDINNTESKNPEQDYVVPGGEKLTPEEVEYLNKQLALATEVIHAQEKINNASYPVSEVEDFDLILANKTHSLSADYKPADLVSVDRFVSGVGNDDTHKLRSVAADALNKMFDAAQQDGIELKLRTGFRSYSYQKSLYDSYVSKNGKAAADTFSARPGYSEHQTGFACDLGGKTEGFALSYDFGKTDEGKWVAEHAHEYGFIIRYTDGKTVDGTRMPGEITGYVFEPWHIRYVGAEHAERINELGITLEEYLGIVDRAEYKE